MPALEICVLLKNNSFYFFLLVQEAAIPVTLCDWSTTITDSCPCIIPMSFMCESFYDIFLWVNIQYSVNVFDSWYVGSI